MNEVPFRSRAALEAEARNLLASVQALRVPVPIDVVADRIGLSVEATILGDGVSGILVVNNGTGSIGYSSEQSEGRQRFTIAHEIGHYKLHTDLESIFIDKSYFYRRDQDSSSGEDRREIQANLFASALLMPQELVLSEIEEMNFDLEDEESLFHLARRFNVSIQAMSLRLANLNIFSDSLPE